MNKLLKNYFYWTYPRGNVHYDVMVTLILLFIFVTPHFWDFGDKPSRVPVHASDPGSRRRTARDYCHRECRWIFPSRSRIPSAKFANGCARPSSLSPATPSP